MLDGKIRVVQWNSMALDLCYNGNYCSICSLLKPHGRFQAVPDEHLLLSPDLYAYRHYESSAKYSREWSRLKWFNLITLSRSCRSEILHKEVKMTRRIHMLLNRYAFLDSKRCIVAWPSGQMRGRPVYNYCRVYN